jgi:hypothetical protein
MNVIIVGGRGRSTSPGWAEMPTIRLLTVGKADRHCSQAFERPREIHRVAPGGRRVCFLLLG